jgi:2-polyprenyl-6-hydroxyphenyl methylase / 3-demethylubiquinone-9 3-methyltransferase
MPATVDDRAAERYHDAAPHLKHREVHTLFERLVHEVVALVATDGRRPRALDLGAGDGTATASLVAAGCDVVAVDVDHARLESLRRRLPAVEVRETDAVAVLRKSGEAWDIVMAVSFLHHVRDYRGLTEAALDTLNPGGVFLSFQDPLLHTSLGNGARAFSRVAYLAWRLSDGDLRGGAARYLRRRRHGYSEMLAEDLEEFHAQRGGVDHRMLLELFRSRGMPARLVVYFSTQSSAFQRMGAALGLQNTFALIGGPA